MLKLLEDKCGSVPGNQVEERAHFLTVVSVSQDNSEGGAILSPIRGRGVLKSPLLCYHLPGAMMTLIYRISLRLKATSVVPMRC